MPSCAALPANLLQKLWPRGSFFPFVAMVMLLSFCRYQTKLAQALCLPVPLFFPVLPCSGWGENNRLNVDCTCF